MNDTTHEMMKWAKQLYPAADPKAVELKSKKGR
jgi:hypothetical protein